MIHIRRANPQDESEELLLKGALRQGRHDLVMVAVENDVIMGCCSIDFAGWECIINSLYVEDEDRVKDIGDGLLRSILYFARRANIKRANVPLTNLNIKLLRSLGFKETVENANILQTDLKELFDSCGCCERNRCPKGI